MSNVKKYHVDMSEFKDPDCGTIAIPFIDFSVFC